jgi:hypothetical protein
MPQKTADIAGPGPRHLNAAQSVNWLGGTVKSTLLSTAVLWIRIRMDSHHFGNLDPHPDPYSHQIKIRIRIRIGIK